MAESAVMPVDIALRLPLTQYADLDAFKSQLILNLDCLRGTDPTATSSEAAI